MPIGDVLVGNPGGDIKHDDATLALDVVAIPQASKLLLPCSIPDIEADGTEVGREAQWVHLDAKSCCE